MAKAVTHNALPVCLQEIEQGASEPPTPHLRAQVALMNRLDTTQLEALCLRGIMCNCIMNDIAI